MSSWVCRPCNWLNSGLVIRCVKCGRHYEELQSTSGVGAPPSGERDLGTPGYRVVGTDIGYVITDRYTSPFEVASSLSRQPKGLRLEHAATGERIPGAVGMVKTGITTTGWPPVGPKMPDDLTFEFDAMDEMFQVTGLALRCQWTAGQMSLWMTSTQPCASVTSRRSTSCPIRSTTIPTHRLL